MTVPHLSMIVIENDREDLAAKQEKGVNLITEKRFKVAALRYQYIEQAAFGIG